MMMDDDRMEDVPMDAPSQFTFQPHAQQSSAAVEEEPVLTQMDRLYQEMRALAATGVQAREFRDIPVKIHLRKPEKDAWTYLGRGVVTTEVVGQHSRVVVRSASSQKTIITFGEDASLVAEKRGNFVVVGCVEAGRVVSWSLNALNNSETLRLLASIDLACYACRQAVSDPNMHKSHRRRIARLIKDDRKRRHKRRRDADAMVAAFARTGLDSIHQESGPPAADPPPLPVPPQPVIEQPQPIFFPQPQL